MRTLSVARLSLLLENSLDQKLLPAGWLGGPCWGRGRHLASRGAAAAQWRANFEWAPQSSSARPPARLGGRGLAKRERNHSEASARRQRRANNRPAGSGTPPTCGFAHPSWRIVLPRASAEAMREGLCTLALLCADSLDQTVSLRGDRLRNLSAAECIALGGQLPAGTPRRGPIKSGRPSAMFLIDKTGKQTLGLEGARANSSV